MVRSVWGVVVGAVAWMLVFFLLCMVLAQFWPDYALHGRTWFRERVFTFTPPMAVCNLLFWVVADGAAGWLVMTIARRRAALWVLAVLLTGYLASQHLLLYWPRFPWWYNLGVVLPALPAMLLGGWGRPVERGTGS
jgi:hypothetical protein